MHHDRLKRLLRQYFDNTISQTDCLELLSYLNENIEEVEHHIDEVVGDTDAGPEFTETQAFEVLNRIKSDIRFADTEPEYKPVVIKFYQKRWLQVAAMLVIILTAAILLLNKNTQKEANTNALALTQKPVVPGGNKATLTMANGKTIVLDSISNGVVANNGSSKIVKVDNGQLVYRAGASTNGLMAYNTLSTPKGGEYQVTLADGTKVWLNAASSLSYPQEFTGNERHVKLTGEAYFEVAKNKDKPFYVTVNNVQVRVLGTHFNITAYSDEDEITTTLLEGAVQVTKNNAKSLLSPGQQAVINNGSNNIAVYEVDANDAIAWKNGYFVFNDEDIVSIMKKVSRWYDIDVEYRGVVGNQKFGGTFYRFKSINELIHYLEKIGKLHFKISERRIIVMG